ncbi:hypothetical protein P152DRAFT_422598 [Eremomyces bilateralis CBS 781.70]|uniref:GPI mannosyltransferase 2 n=1 Tax=Eremomyces bilateralis CBS 781.70 TaxID=1392243 RepID=A0A6G1FVM1_9PEZI|nr:uncharacterized protein P152DRAFT_422598 [Eremomyces bilateralis CBS 781.70]KAF1809689.1 hypothetical protein P152DRAFT_422598 [Eremomyces bilateralis CBS 781.70]
MSTWRQRIEPHRHPLLSLLVIFLVWKACLVGIILFSPWSGYDTDCAEAVYDKPTSPHLALSSRWLLRFLRWDAVYFTDIARDGYRYEQQWAFSWGFATLIRYVADCIHPASSSILNYIWSGLIITNTSHLLSVFVLYYLTLFITGSSNHAGFDDSIAFTTAALHVLSPAGVFLTAPYGESLFSFLHFTSLYFYLQSLYHSNKALFTSPSPLRHLWLLPSAILLSLAVLPRSNGLFSGAIYLLDLLSTLSHPLARLPFFRRILSATQQFFTSPPLFATRAPTHPLLRASLIIPSGLLVLLTFSYPQYLAWQQFCGASSAVREPRPWCKSFPPSIYAFVQSTYWDVGFLHYWTVPNLPLFVMVAPALCLLIQSSMAAIRGELVFERSPISREKIGKESRSGGASDGVKKARKDDDEGQEIQKMVLARLAIPQLLLAVTAIMSYHVQIVLRLCSGYPLWYMAVALAVQGRWQLTLMVPFTTWRMVVPPKAIVMWMIIYAGVQAGLYGAFLPPA